MKKIVFLLFFIILSSKVNAQDEQFEHAGQNLGEAKIIEMPACNNKDFEAKIIEAAETYFENTPVSSISAKRKKFLTLKSLNGFEQASAQNFSPETDFNTASALIMVKINEHVEEKDILLCRQKEGHNPPIYVIAYPYMDNIKAYIINLDEENPDYHAVSLIYP